MPKTPLFSLAGHPPSPPHRSKPIQNQIHSSIASTTSSSTASAAPGSPPPPPPSLSTAVFPHPWFGTSTNSRCTATITSPNWVHRLNIDDFEIEDAVRPDFPCPYCYEDFEIVSLCSHLEDEHLFESKSAEKVCRLVVENQ
ncbi:hypothetical protein RHGRI_025380 [Rhododendron griersonianum]|uniref:Di19 zinc-binding domain-containing protein n=1 Tax=Rhododendron griersonianum TaxID=479676 RepID=A0AAV6ISE7_9ERIC|nr:hypothetical protein RHGRI_025380 [Rhododendron griersonianum]